jgi:hypothetical protein
MIDINYRPNPFPDVCAVRALIMAAKLQFAISRDLSKFVLQRVEETGIEGLRQAQISRYGQERSPSPELRSWITTIERQITTDSERVEIIVSPSRQASLWNGHPPNHVDTRVSADGQTVRR